MNEDSKKNHVKEFWAEKLKVAKETACKVRNGGKRNGILIEVAAQHPLEIDGTPRTEFAKRLDMRFELYSRKRQENIHCKLYVPGSLHMHNGAADKVSLSEAGRIYLVEKGVLSKDIYGEDKNVK